MKKFIVYFAALFLLLALCLCACTEGVAPANPTDTSTAESGPELTEPTAGTTGEETATTTGGEGPSATETSTMLRLSTATTKRTTAKTTITTTRQTTMPTTVTTTTRYVPSYQVQTIIDKFGDERVVLIGLTVDIDFTDDDILVVIKRRFSQANMPYYPSDFPEIECAEVIHLTSLNYPQDALVNWAEFRQILQLKLKNPGKQNVIDSIDALAENEFIYAAEPNFIYGTSY